MNENDHEAPVEPGETDDAGTGEPAGDIELAPGRAIGLRRAVLAGLAVSAVAYAASLDLASYAVAHTTCCP
jgi:hypothetical protein